jgi:heat shock protein HslJ
LKVESLKLKAGGVVAAKSLMVGLLLFICSCATVKQKMQGNDNIDPQLNNIVWEITSYKGRPLNTNDFPNGAPSITFHMEDGKISGNDGCNSFMGLATYHSHTIKTGAIATTKMSCAGGIQQDFYATIGSDALTYHLENGILRLYVNDAEVMALKEKE